MPSRPPRTPTAPPPPEYADESRSSGGDEVVSTVVDLLVQQTQAMTTTNLRLDAIERSLEGLDHRLETIEHGLDKQDLTKKIGDKIDKAMSTQETDRAAAEAKKAGADLEFKKVEADVEKARFENLTKIFEKAKEMLSTPVVESIVRVVVILLLGWNILPGRCTLPLSALLANPAKEEPDVHAPGPAPKPEADVP